MGSAKRELILQVGRCQGRHVLIFFSTHIAKCNFTCLMHSEAKQTKASEFGANKGLFQGQAKRWVSCAPPAEALNSFTISGKHFSRQGDGGAWLVVAGFLVLESFVLAANPLGQVIVLL